MSYRGQDTVPRVGRFMTQCKKPWINPAFMTSCHKQVYGVKIIFLNVNIDIANKFVRYFA